MKRLPTFTRTVGLARHVRPSDPCGELVAEGPGYKVWRAPDAYLIEGTPPSGPVPTLDGGTLLFVSAKERTVVSRHP